MLLVACYLTSNQQLCSLFRYLLPEELLLLLLPDDPPEDAWAELRLGDDDLAAEELAEPRLGDDDLAAGADDLDEDTEPDLL